MLQGWGKPAVALPMSWAPRRLRARKLLSYGPAVLFTIVAVVSVARAFASARRYSQDVLESTQLLSEGNELRGSIATAQSSVRGFAITGRDEYLEPYRYAEHELRRKRLEAGTTWAARPAQRAQVIRALDLFFKWKHQTAEPVIATRASAESTTLLVRGGPTLERANQLLGEVIENERNLLQIRSRRNESAARWGMIVVIAAPLLVLAYVVAASYFMARRTVRAIESVSRAARAVSKGDLSQRVQPTATDEIRSLAHSFNAMAERLTMRTSEASLLTELAQMLQVTQSEREVGELFQRYTCQLLSVRGARLYSYDPVRREFVSTLSWGPRRPESFSGSACWAVRLGKPYHSTGQDGPPCDHLGELDGSLSLCLPLVVQGEVLGLIQYLYEEGARDPILRLGMAIAERCAFTISNLRLRQRLQEESIRDPLTGLLNRRYLEEAFEREIERARRLDRPLGLLMIDIDHFKALNDAAGHAAGDAVLRSFGSLLVSAFRAGDEAYRYGGEEFLVLMPDAALEDVIERARTLQSRIAHLHVAFDGSAVPAITASMGISAFPEDGDDAATLIRAADDALLQAKQSGRNRIVATRPEGPPREPPLAPPPGST